MSIWSFVHAAILLSFVIKPYASAADSYAQYSTCVQNLKTQYLASLSQANAACLARNPSNGVECDAGDPDSAFDQVKAGEVQKCYEMAYQSREESSTPDVTVPKANTPLPKSKPPIAQQPTKPAKPVPPAKANPTDDPDVAQSNADADIAACDSLQGTATQCCNNPLSCASAADQASAAQLRQQTAAGPQAGQSIASYCSQMSQVNNNNGNLNINLAGVCASNQNSCRSTCSQLAQRYQQLMSNCSGCASSSVYQDAYYTLNQKASACSALQANANAMGSQGVSSASPQAAGTICNQQASAQSALPPGYGGATPGDPYGCASNPTSAACQSCTINPTSPTCKALAASQANSGGSDGFQNGSKKTDSSAFNVGNVNDQALAAMNANLNTNTDSQGPAPQQPTVPNNTGGAIPGSQGSTTSAQLGNAPTKAPATAASDKADILKGNFSGGYSQSSGSGSGFENYDNNRFPASTGVTVASGYLGMDLKKYLPGGSRDPNRSIAGIGGLSEINGKGVDLFKKISNKIEEKCRLGILWECKP